MATEFRMYENKYPEVEELVMCVINNIAENEMGAYVSLLEYAGIEGMIQFSEVSRRRIRSISKLLRVGRQEALVVLRVDKEKGYIDLSKRRVSEEDTAKCEERFNKSKAVHSIMRHVATTTHTPIETLYQNIAWPLYRKYGHAYDAFKAAITDPEELFKESIITLGQTPEEIEQVKDELIKNIRRRLTPHPVKIRADIDVTCFHYEGIDAIKRALKAGLVVSTPDTPIKIQLSAPPTYVMVTTSMDRDLGIKLLNESIEKVKEHITSEHGDLTLKSGPRAMTEREELELDKLEQSGSSDDESDESDEEK